MVLVLQVPMVTRVQVKWVVRIVLVMPEVVDTGDCAADGASGWQLVKQGVRCQYLAPYRCRDDGEAD